MTDLVRQEHEDTAPHEGCQCRLCLALHDIERMKKRVGEASQEIVRLEAECGTHGIWEERHKQRAEKAEAACAEMGAVLSEHDQWHRHEKWSSFEWRDGTPDSMNLGEEYEDSALAEHTEKALSSDCGKGWVSPEEAGVLRVEIDELKAANHFELDIDAASDRLKAYTEKLIPIVKERDQLRDQLSTAVVERDQALNELDEYNKTSEAKRYEAWHNELADTVNQRDQARDEIEAKGRVIERWQTDTLIESDFIRADGTIAIDPYAENTRLRAEVERLKQEAKTPFAQGEVFGIGQANKLAVEQETKALRERVGGLEELLRKCRQSMIVLHEGTWQSIGGDNRPDTDDLWSWTVGQYRSMRECAEAIDAALNQGKESQVDGSGQPRTAADEQNQCDLKAIPGDEGKSDSEAELPDPTQSQVVADSGGKGANGVAPYGVRFPASESATQPSGEGRGRCRELEAAIVAFCKFQQWAHDDWKRQEHIAPLFEIADKALSGGGDE